MNRHILIDVMDGYESIPIELFIFFYLSISIGGVVAGLNYLERFRALDFYFISMVQQR